VYHTVEDEAGNVKVTL